MNVVVASEATEKTQGFGSVRSVVDFEPAATKSVFSKERRP